MPTPGSEATRGARATAGAVEEPGAEAEEVGGYERGARRKIAGAHGDSLMSAENYDLAVIGSGPAGQKAAIAGYEQQLADIVPEAATRPEAIPAQIQQALAALQTQIVTLEERLVAGQQALSEQLSQQQVALLAHIDTRHRETLERVTARLKADQLETVDLLYDLVDQQQLAQWELDEITTLVQQSLAKLKDAPNADYWQQLLVAAEGTEALDQKRLCSPRS